MKSNTFLIINDSIVNTDSTIYRISKSLINDNKDIIIISSKLRKHLIQLLFSMKIKK